MNSLVHHDKLFQRRFDGSLSDTQDLPIYTEENMLKALPTPTQVETSEYRRGHLDGVRHCRRMLETMLTTADVQFETPVEALDAAVAIMVTFLRDQ